jgi:hypothetical protein
MGMPLPDEVLAEWDVLFPDTHAAHVDPDTHAGFVIARVRDDDTVVAAKRVIPAGSALVAGADGSRQDDGQQSGRRYADAMAAALRTGADSASDARGMP